MSWRSFARGASAALVLVLLVSGEARALTDEEVFRDFRFNFLNPGAKALGLGGAFIAAADDATAAEANPAALHYIFQMQAFAEYRTLDFETQAFTTTQPVGDIGDLNNPVLPFVDIQSVNNREDADLPSFASFAFPFSIGHRRATIAVSRQVVLDLVTTLSDSNLPAGGQDTQLEFALAGFQPYINPETLEPEIAIINESEGRLDTELVNLNVSFSISFGDLSLGLTGTQATLDMVSSLQSIAKDPRGLLQPITNPRVDRDSDGFFEDLATRSIIDGDDSDFTYSLGLLYRPDSRFRGIAPIRVGAVYRKGADLAVDERVEEDPGSGVFAPREQFQNRLRVPDRYGLGVAGWLGRERSWLFALDLERIEYSDLLQDFRSGVNFFTSGTITQVVDPDAKFVYDVDDATVVHAGVEYTKRTRGSWLFQFRGGYFNAPDNRIRMVDANLGDPELENVFLDVFRGGADEDHLTAGASLIWGGQGNTAFELQFAGDFADTQDQLLLSTILRFGAPRR